MNPRIRLGLQVLVAIATVISVGVLWFGPPALVISDPALAFVSAGVLTFVGLVVYKLVQGDRDWFAITALTTRGAIEQREMLEDMRNAVPQPCWRCGRLAPVGATECPSCDASLA